MSKENKGVITPRSGNYYGRRHSLAMATLPSGQLSLSLTNGKGTWSSDVLMDLDEVAVLQRVLAEHVEAVALAQRIGLRAS